LLETLQKADFLMLFSNYESQPCVILEAMACGKPILATKVGGIPEMIDSSRGLLTAPSDVISMSHAFSWLLDHSSEFSSEDIRTFVLQNYSYAKVGQQIVEVYHKILSA
jgi:glycosyltransferase involved in cell wall biosynthesis